MMNRDFSVLELKNQYRYNIKNRKNLKKKTFIFMVLNDIFNKKIELIVLWRLRGGFGPKCTFFFLYKNLLHNVVPI